MFSYKISFLFVVTNLIATILTFNCPSCEREWSTTMIYAERTLKISLKKLAAGDGPYYKLADINSASIEEESSILYKIRADLLDRDNKEKTCNIEILHEPWREKGTQVTFDCPGEQKLVKAHEFSVD